MESVESTRARTSAGPAPSAGTPIVEVEGLVKRYPKRPVNAVDGVSFTIHRGEVFGLLGPNGAGKTTTIGVLTTRVLPTGGRARIDGIDVARRPAQVKARIGVVPQRANQDRALTARQNLLFHGAYFGLSRAERTARADALLGELGLGERGDDLVDRYSGGQSQRLMIARALMHDPTVLFLDEPTTGLDPQARLFVWDRIRSLRARGITILLTTHDMDEAAELADRVAIMDHGRLLALDTPTGLTGLVPGSSSVQVTIDPRSVPDDGAEAALADLASLPGVRRVERVAPSPLEGEGRSGGEGWAEPTQGDGELADGPVIRLYGDDDPGTLVVPVVQRMAAHRLALRDVRLGQASLEDVFIHLTGRGLRG
jgi:ABC-2 type transport system ATP-binding protein